MRNDAFLWYLIGRRRGRREALQGLGYQPKRKALRALLLFLLGILLISAVVYTWAFVSAALGRAH